MQVFYMIGFYLYLKSLPSGLFWVGRTLCFLGPYTLFFIGALRNANYGNFLFRSAIAVVTIVIYTLRVRD